jgi:sugar lactone lactonase YvrE
MKELGDLATRAQNGDLEAFGRLIGATRAGSGMGTIFNAESGDVVASDQFQTSPTFINDVVLTHEAAYFTDTQAPFLYRVALGPAGTPAIDATPIPLPGTFRTSGIAVTPNGEHLFVVDGGTAQLYRIDTATHTPVLVDLGGDTLANADGLLLDRRFQVPRTSNQTRVPLLHPFSDTRREPG